MAKLLRLPTTASFKRGKDKAPRKKKTLLGHALKGAGYGGGAMLGLGTLEGVRHSFKPYSRRNDLLNRLWRIDQGMMMGGAYAPKAALAGAAIGTGIYGAKKIADKFRGNNDKPLKKKTNLR